MYGFPLDPMAGLLCDPPIPEMRPIFPPRQGQDDAQNRCWECQVSNGGRTFHARVGFVTEELSST